MNSSISLLDVVALMEDLAEQKLFRGQVGTVVEELDFKTYLVEFSDDNGQTYAMLPLKIHQIMLLHFHPIQSSVSSIAKVS
jgi:Domain of unknown function (DUF4926)